MKQFRFILHTLLLVQTVFSAFAKHALKQQQRENTQSNSGIIRIASKDEIPQYFNDDKDYYLLIKLTPGNSNQSAVTVSNNNKFNQAYHRIANHVLTTYPNSQSIFFLEYEDNEDYLSNLNLSQAPQMWIYPPSDKIYYPASMSVQPPPNDGRLPRPLEIGFTSEHYQFVLPVSKDSGSIVFDEQELLLKLAKLVSSSCDIDIIINDFTQIEPIKVVTYCALFYFLIKSVKIYGASKWLYCVICISLCLVNISGLNYCLQRGVPLVTRNKRGDGALWAYDGARMQLGVEVFESIGAQLIIATLFGLLIEVSLLKDGEKKDEKKKDSMWWLLALSISMLLFLSYSGFLNLYVGYKDTGYPYNPVRII